MATRVITAKKIKEYLAADTYQDILDWIDDALSDPDAHKRVREVQDNGDGTYTLQHCDRTQRPVVWLETTVRCPCDLPESVWHAPE